jgi:hypothetical protein
MELSKDLPIFSIINEHLQLLNKMDRLLLGVIVTGVV